jgi:hypothetical protein
MVPVDLSSDIWANIFEYLSSLDDLSAVTQVSRQFHDIFLQNRCQLILFVTSPSFPLRRFLGEGPRVGLSQPIAKSLRGLHIRSNIPCTSKEVLSIARSRLVYGELELFTLSKCFRVDESVFELLQLPIASLAICDISLRNILAANIHAIQPSSYVSSSIKHLVLTNCVFPLHSITVLLLTLPKSLCFLGLGGCTITASFDDNSNYDIVLDETSRQDDSLVVEVTFLAEIFRNLISDLLAVRRGFKIAMIDLACDHIDKICTQLSHVGLHSSLRSLLANAHNEGLSTVLHQACRDRDLPRINLICRTMLGRSDLTDGKGAYAIQRAVEADDALATDALLSSYLVCHPPNHRHIDLFEHVCNDARDRCLIPIASYLQHVNHYSETPLYIAALYGKSNALRIIQRYMPSFVRLSVLQILGYECLVSWSDVDALDVCRRMKTYLGYCASSSNLNRLERFVSMIQSARTPNKTSKGKSSERQRLKVVSGMSMSQLSRCLPAEYDCSLIDLIFSDSTGYSPLHAAVINRSVECVQILLEMGCKPNYPNLSMETPLQLALQRYQHMEIVTLCMKYSIIN